ncbi:MAG: hypothetical protein II537_03510 [Bacteroidales bacterium]|nr:hypothetical protein [Bacteroidales bacterium]
MRTLTHICSQRKFAPYPSFQIVYEWEDILARSLGLRMNAPGEISNIFHRRFEKNGLTGLYHSLLPSSSLGLRYIMTATTQELCWNNRNSIPVLIDFWLEEADLPAFFKAYRHVPLMLVSNREVYDFLLAHNCPFPVAHWALSMPDYYLGRLDRPVEKKYDFCVFGRPNPFFMRFLEEYSRRHPAFEYVLNNGDIDKRCYVSNKGRSVAKDTGRASYLEMIAATRVSCYTTPGLDEAKAESSRYNQVTPRLFEMLSHQCHVIGHYPDNADTQWYGLDGIVPNTEGYDEFESQLDRMLAEPFPIEAAKHFLAPHTTGHRALELRRILEDHQISLGR